MALWSGEGSRGSYSFCIEGCCRGRSAGGGGRGGVWRPQGALCTATLHNDHNWQERSKSAQLSFSVPR